jgi:predicted acyl esterase
MVAALKGDAYDSIGPSAKADEIDASVTPMLILQGWFDDPGAAVKTYSRLTNPRHLILGPWNHYLQNGSPFARWHGSGFNLGAEILRFFDHYLKGLDNGYEDLRSHPVLHTRGRTVEAAKNLAAGN